MLRSLLTVLVASLAACSPVVVDFTDGEVTERIPLTDTDDTAVEDSGDTEDTDTAGGETGDDTGDTDTAGGETGEDTAVEPIESEFTFDESGGYWTLTIYNDGGCGELAVTDVSDEDAPWQGFSSANEDGSGRIYEIATLTNPDANSARYTFTYRTASSVSTDADADTGTHCITWGPEAEQVAEEENCLLADPTRTSVYAIAE